MPNSERTYTLTFHAPVSIFTGLDIAGLIDRIAVRDVGGLLYVPGSNVKGRLRFFADRLLQPGSLLLSYMLHAQNQPLCKGLNQSTADWYCEVRQWTGEIGGSAMCVYQCRVVQFREYLHGLSPVW